MRHRTVRPGMGQSAGRALLTAGEDSCCVRNYAAGFWLGRLVANIVITPSNRGGGEL